jgi:CubicO group peptidase (beta-lactamase class C family)
MKKLFFVSVISVFALFALSCKSVTDNKSETASQKIDALASKYNELNRFNGNILVAKDGNIILSKGYGFANAEWNIPNTPQTKFLLASVSKTFTATLIAKLIDQGKLSLNTKLSEVLPWYRNDTGNKITIFHLLNHTSGIPNYLNQKQRKLQDIIRDFGTNSIDKKEFAIKYCSSDLEFEPGTKWNYNNSAYFLLGLIVEEISGKSFDLAAKEMIFDPLKMESSGDLQPNPNAVINNLATGYVRTPEGFNQMPYWNLSTAYAAGSLYSTVEDLLKFDRAFCTDTFVSPKMKEAMFTPFLNGYGCGWELREIPIGANAELKKVQTHEGFLWAWHTRFFRIPQDGYCIVILSNAGDAPLERIFSGITDILYGRDTELPKPSLSELIDAELRVNGIQSAIALGEKLLRENKNSFETDERDLNRMGYRLLNTNQVELAVEIFRLNTDLYPQSWNVWDSYGEALAKLNRNDEAIAAYKKSLELNPSNKGGEEMITRLIRGK